MAVSLPTTPWASEVLPGLINYGVKRPGSPLGGVRRSYSRPGSRHRLDVRLPPIAHGDEADAWVAALLEAEGSLDPVRFVVPQNNPREYRSVTGVLVNGGSQAGRTLNVDTITLGSGTTFPKARAISFEVAGRSYLYYTTAAPTVTGGACALTLDCRLRASPADNTPVLVNSPIIEGDIEGDVRSWTVANATLEGLEFTITERE